MADIHALARPLERLELALAEVYEELAAVYQDDAEARGLFSRLAMDERSHAAQVAYLRRLAAQNPQAFAEVDLDVAGVLAATDDVATLRSHLRTVPLTDTLRLLLDVEEKAGEAHGRQAVAAACRELSTLLASLSRGDQEHVARLRRFAMQRRIATPAGKPKSEDAHR